MRWLVSAAVLLFGGAVLGQTAEEIAVCGSYSPPSGTYTVVGGPYCLEYIGGSGVSLGWKQFSVSWNNTYGHWYAMRSPPESSTTCSGSMSSSVGSSYTEAVAAWESMLSTYCKLPDALLPPEEPGEPDPWEEWMCFDDMNTPGLEPGYQFCHMLVDDGTNRRVVYTTPCSTENVKIPADTQELIDLWDEWENTVCEVEPPPTEPDGSPLCTGADGLACENTLRDIRYILEQMRYAESLPPTPTPVIEMELDLGEVTVPSFDRDDPTWEGWVEPDFTELEQDTLTARVQAGVLELRSLAETKFPFGMVTWVPTGDVAGAGSCDDPQIALMGTDARGIGWCDSAMELFLAGFGRAALAVLMTIGFGFGVVRTVSLS